MPRVVPRACPLLRSEGVSNEKQSSKEYFSTFLLLLIFFFLFVLGLRGGRHLYLEFGYSYGGCWVPVPHPTSLLSAKDGGGLKTSLVAMHRVYRLEGIQLGERHSHGLVRDPKPVRVDLRRHGCTQNSRSGLRGIREVGRGAERGLTTNRNINKFDKSKAPACHGDFILD
jgi:hypothetical protein